MSRACPLCGGGASQGLVTMRYVLFDDSSLPRSTRIDRCVACGFVFANSDATAEDYARHYQANSVYSDPGIRAGAGVTPPDLERLRVRALRIADAVGPGDLFVDVGAGAGGLMEVLRDTTGCEVFGIDPDPACVAALRRSGLPAACATLDSLPAAMHGKAAAVALSHVLEHLWDPVDGVRSAMRLLRPGGLLYLETPDSAHYGACPNVPYYYFDPEHINHFRLEDFQRLASQLGFRWVNGAASETRLDEGTRYPICWALLEKPATPHEPSTSVQGLTERTDLMRYVEQESAAFCRLSERLRERIPATLAPFLVWGAGSHAQRLLATDAIAPSAILQFVDSDPAKLGRTLCGRAIRNPAEAMAAHPAAPIVILAAQAASAAIRRDLERQSPTRTVLDTLPAEGERATLHA